MQSAINFLSIQEYLQLEKTSDIRHEYIDGEVFAMAGASEEHNLITVTNVIALLRPHLRGTPCRTFASDMKVKVKVEKADIFYYPDVLVTCDTNDNERYFKTSPKLIVEVLSNSTKTIDKREKRLNYQNIESFTRICLNFPR